LSVFLHWLYSHAIEWMNIIDCLDNFEKYVFFSLKSLKFFFWIVFKNITSHCLSLSCDSKSYIYRSFWRSYSLVIFFYTYVDQFFHWHIVFKSEIHHKLEHIFRYKFIFYIHFIYIKQLDNFYYKGKLFIKITWIVSIKKIEQILKYITFSFLCLFKKYIKVFIR